MHRPARVHVLQFFDGFEYPQPNDFALSVALSREGIGPFLRLNGGAIAVAVYQRLGGAPEVYIAYDLRLALGFFRGFA